MNLLYEYDHFFLQKSERLIGVDEAGRGSLAGPVVIAAVILDLKNPINEINDSKKLKPEKREKLFDKIIQSAISYKIVEVDSNYIDKHNILQATLKGMFDAVTTIAQPSDCCLIDGNKVPNGLFCYSKSIIHGDALSASIAAASILAKVHRDQLMRTLDKFFPLYGFAKHKGYGTAQHLNALKLYGPCSIHRKTFSPIAKMIDQRAL
ncbi:MAG: ribonuclease HII [Candidatus Cloacimonetes bacterium]|jgi:ribonuclease HII|nr:ribonuclease HII [Candidatus Cloacimonadota bacterium]MCB5258209.1 ribonuclease HII [Candidatus Cloacimonadota bacterium]MDD5625137.1 ribonuclease HII [Candidatus Cloacimonadota bacterium]